MQVAARLPSSPRSSFVLPMAGGEGSWGEVKGGLSLNRGNVSFGADVESTLGRRGYKDDRAVVGFALRF